MTEIQKGEISEAYEDVRNDATPTSWAVLAYNENTIVLSETGSDFEEFKSKFNDEERLFGFLRLTTSEEPNFKSKREKFALITWIGNNVSPLKRAKVSTDKTFVKAVLQNFAVEIQTSDVSEINEDNIRSLMLKAGGANYGTGTRDD